MIWFRHFLTFCLLVCQGSASFAGGGASDGGGGGDPRYAMEFSAIAYELVARLVRQPIEGVDAKRLAAFIGRTRINSTTKILRDRNGELADALNFPNSRPPRILMNRAAWDHLKTVPLGQMRLVLHEYLGIMKVDDTGHHLSNKLNQTRVCERSPSVRKTLEVMLRLPCERIEVRDLAAIKYLAFADLAHWVIAEALAPQPIDRGNPISHNGLFGEIPPPYGLELDYRAIDFNQLTGLKGLQLANVRTLTKGVLDDLQNLEKLNVASVRLERITTGAFANLHSLKYLSIETGTRPITDQASLQFDSGAFTGLESLKELRIFTTRKFTGDINSMAASLMNLQTLKVTMAEPTDIPHEFFGRLKNLRHFEYYMPKGENRNSREEFLQRSGFTAPEWQCEYKIGHICHRRVPPL